LYLIDTLPRKRDWIAYGAFWGIVALVNTTLVLMMPLAVAVLWYRWKRKLQWPAILALTVFAVTLTPWTVRNYIVFHKVIPVRGNFGPNLWYGNHPDVLSPRDESLDPTQNTDELHDYVRLGESQYARSRQLMALQFIRQNPARFVRLTRNRIAFFWAAGLGADRPALGSAIWSLLAFTGVLLILRNKPINAAVFAASLLFYPIPYYLTLAEAFYRHPIDPIMTILVVYACFTLAELVMPAKAETRLR